MSDTALYKELKNIINNIFIPDIGDIVIGYYGNKFTDDFSLEEVVSKIKNNRLYETELKERKEIETQLVVINKFDATREKIINERIKKIEKIIHKRITDSITKMSKSTEMEIWSEPIDRIDKCEQDKYYIYTNLPFPFKLYDIKTSNYKSKYYKSYVANRDAKVSTNAAVMLCANNESIKFFKNRGYGIKICMMLSEHYFFEPYYNIVLQISVK